MVDHAEYAGPAGLVTTQAWVTCVTSVNNRMDTLVGRAQVESRPAL